THWEQQELVWTEKLEQTDAELQAARLAYQELSDKHDQTLQQLDTTSQQLAENSKQLEDASLQLQSTSSQLDATTRQLETATQQLEAARDHETTLLAKQQQLEASITHWEQQELVWTEKLEQTDAELQAARLAYQELSDKHDQTLQQLDTASQQLEDASQQLEATSRQLEVATQQLEAARDHETTLLAKQQQLEASITHW
ncbi:hypothetical protein, partial [Brevibacillus sp. SAFN-007a]|uniref:hypothetical protein n=1 Tax=Brevibacillus sp. SAFN-007a TaxID=3436862 RepID=UPI003F819F1A